jgi:hypothetical protein
MLDSISGGQAGGVRQQDRRLAVPELAVPLEVGEL